MSFIHKLILFSFLLTGCVHDPVPDTSGSDSWALADRVPYYDEKIHVHFKSGNIRTGKLVQSSELKKIELGGTANKGIYSLKEVTAIYSGPRLIWQNN